MSKLWRIRREERRLVHKISKSNLETLIPCFDEFLSGCPHMTCKCGSEYCWNCLRPWASHDLSSCKLVQVSQYELRSSRRDRFYTKAIHQRYQRAHASFTNLWSILICAKLDSTQAHLLLATYIELNTLAEYLYVLIQSRRMDVNIRSVLSQTAKRLSTEAYSISLAVEYKRINQNYITALRNRVLKTVTNLVYMKKKGIIIQ